ncbi:MAG: adenylate/guanylate cyclase domain-containing protein [Planctomycetota bacterium]
MPAGPLLMEVVATILSVICAALVLVVLAMRRRLMRVDRALDRMTMQLEHLQGAFHRFVPQDVVEDIIHRGVATRGERREVTVLFADLVGFTALSERVEPETVVRVLNGYFQTVTRAIASHNGFVSKFMGDGLMAIFGAPEPNPWQAMDGVHAALAMRDALRRYNLELSAAGHPELAISVGLHRGEVIAGVIGSAELVEYTVIGDTVNTAARIESLTRRHACDILISESVREKLDARFRVEERPPTEVKGKQEAVATWAVVAFTAPAHGFASPLPDGGVSPARSAIE